MISDFRAWLASIIQVSFLFSDWSTFPSKSLEREFPTVELWIFRNLRTRGISQYRAQILRRQAKRHRRYFSARNAIIFIRKTYQCRYSKWNRSISGRKFKSFTCEIRDCQFRPTRRTWYFPNEPIIQSKSPNISYLFLGWSMSFRLFFFVFFFGQIPIIILISNGNIRYKWYRLKRTLWRQPLIWRVSIEMICMQSHYCRLIRSLSASNQSEILVDLNMIMYIQIHIICMYVHGQNKFSLNGKCYMFKIKFSEYTYCSWFRK